MTALHEIQIQNVSKRFRDTQALQNVSFRFEEGKIYGLLGRNGAGKSTLINIICNRLFADQGSILVDGQPAAENPEAQNKIFCMSDKETYPSSLRVLKVFKLTNSFYDCFQYEKALSYAEKFGLPLGKKISSLSTGYRSIFKLILALCLNVPYVFFDEPVLGLDANHRELFYRLLLQEYEENPRTIILATHLIEEVANLIEDVVIIDRGRMILQSPVEDLVSKGYSISGLEQEVEDYCRGKDVIGEERLGGLKVAYIMGAVDRSRLTDRLTVSPITLQKLFVKLTESEEERI